MQNELATSHQPGLFKASYPVRALILDDNRVDRLRIARLCKEADLKIHFDEAATLAEFQEAIATNAYDLFLIDYRLGEGDGLIALDVLSRHSVQSDASVIMIAGDSQIQVAIDALKGGCSDFLLKDHLTPDRLMRTIIAALQPKGDGAARRQAVQYVDDHGADMRAILSSMLRHVRTLRSGGQAGAEMDGLEASCARLWNFLEALKSETRVTPMPQRLN